MSGRVVLVVPDVPAIRREFAYRIPARLPGAGVDVVVGTAVRVPLHGRRVRGWVVDDDVAPAALETEGVDAGSLHELLAVVSAGPPADVVDLARWAAWRWAGALATFLRAASAPNVVRSVATEQETAVYPGEALAGAVLDVVAPRREVAVPIAPEGSTLVVDPSAARAAQLAERWRAEGRDVVTLGADHPEPMRTEQWARARAGACVVIGGRSAVWAPVPDLTAVVVLDEVDEALEDERAPTWNARDVAFERARRTGAALRVITPAPSVDAVVALRSLRVTLGGSDPAVVAPPPRSWPRVELVDQRDEEPGHGLLSAALADALRATTARGARAVCVLNRRGRARLLACRTCAELARCEVCGATVEQDDDGTLRCGRCATVRPSVCLHCHGSTFRAVRPGIGRVRDDLAGLLPRSEVAAVDAAAVDVPDVPVLIGTEAVLHRASGPVGLVAFLELDQELLAPRTRATEQALWLLVRGARLVDEQGRLLVQTRLPDHEVVQAVRTGDPLAAVAVDEARRTQLGFPPFGGVAELRGAVEAVAAACEALRAQAGTAGGPGVVVLGPTADGASALVRAPSVAALCDALAAPEVDASRSRGRLRVDVDPRRI